MTADMNPSVPLSDTGDSSSSVAPVSGQSTPLSGTASAAVPHCDTFRPASAPSRHDHSAPSDVQRDCPVSSAARRGLFITFEGGEGCGKSVQISRFAEYLRTRGCNVVMTREPGGTPVGKEIRRLLVEGDKDKFDEITEILLFYADRRIDLTQVVSLRLPPENAFSPTVLTIRPSLTSFTVPANLPTPE